MAKCPFLSTYKNKVNCFNQCPFHEYEDSNGVCPFQSINDEKDLRKDYESKELFKNESINLLDELYREKNFTEIFQNS